MAQAPKKPDSKSVSPQSTAAPKTDDRLKRSTEGDSRLLASEDRTAVDEREVTDSRRLDVSMDDWSFDKMPQLPVIPGFKTIWLSTTHKQDTISRRKKLGYTEIRPEEAPDLAAYSTQSGDNAGAIICEELMAFKLPEELWFKYMNHFHHTKPLMDEAGIKEEIERIQEQAAAFKGRVEFEGGASSGFHDMGRNRRAVFK